MVGQIWSWWFLVVAVVMIWGMKTYYRKGMRMVKGKPLLISDLSEGRAYVVLRLYSPGKLVAITDIKNIQRGSEAEYNENNLILDVSSHRELYVKDTRFTYQGNGKIFIFPASDKT